MKTLTRPTLNQIHLEPVMPGGRYITMSPFQWDEFLDEAYRTGATLIEVDLEERVMGMYRKPILN